MKKKYKMIAQKVLILSVGCFKGLLQAMTRMLNMNIYIGINLLMQKGEQEKKQFIVPKKEDLIEEIKILSDQIEHISLNLIKCDFNAVQKDVEKSFPDFHFIKVKKYNPGSFEVIFETRIDAINFIRNCFDKKILTRRFFIKMGRQQKQHAENWSAVGYVPKQFKQAPRRIIGGRQKQPVKQGEVQQETQEGGKVETKPQHAVQPKVEHKVEHKVAQHKVQHKVEHKVQHKVDHKAEHKVEHKAQTKPQHKVEKGDKKIEPKVQHKVQHKAEHKVIQNKAQHKPSEHTKPADHKVIPKMEYKPKTADNKQHGEARNKQQTHPAQKPAENKPAEKKVEHPVATHKVQQKKQHKVEHKVEHKAEHKVEQKKGAQKKEVKVEQKKVHKEQQKKEEDDGWIVVPTKKGKNPKK